MFGYVSMYIYTKLPYMNSFKRSSWSIVTEEQRIFGIYLSDVWFIVQSIGKDQRRTSAQGMHEKLQPEGKPLLVTMAAHQPGEGKGKSKDGGWGGAEVGDCGITYAFVFF